MGKWSEWMGDTPQSHTARAPAVLKTSQSRIIRSITTLKVRASEMHQLLQLPAASNVINAAAVNTFAAAVSTSSTIAGGAAALSLIFHFKCSCKSVTHKRWDLIQLIALLNLSVLGFSFVFHDKAKRTQQGNLLDLIWHLTHVYTYILQTGSRWNIAYKGLCTPQLTARRHYIH